MENTVYMNDWAEGGKEQMVTDFAIDPTKLDGAEILVASYTYECYEGMHMSFFGAREKLFEVHGSHCSCYGLEDQWEPEETTKEAIVHRLTNGTWGEEGKIAKHAKGFGERGMTTTKPPKTTTSRRYGRFPDH